MLEDKKKQINQTTRLSCNNLDYEQQTVLYDSNSLQDQNQSLICKTLKQKMTQNIKFILIFSLILIIFGATFINSPGNGSSKIQTVQLIEPKDVQHLDIPQKKNQQKIQQQSRDILKEKDKIRKEVTLNKQNQDISNLIQVNQIKNNQQQIQISKNKDIAGLQQFTKPAFFLPRILWLYTQYRYQSEKMVEQMFGNFIVHKARQSNFQVRFVNAWSAYQWISNKTEAKITKSMQNRQIEVSVNELLRLALLMEHGGIILRVSESLLVDGFEWLYQYFMIHNQVLIFSESTLDNPRPVYYDYFLAALPKAQLIIDTFENLCKVIISYETRKDLKLTTLINQQVNSTYVPDITRNIIHSLLQLKSLQNYATHSINVDVSSFLRKQCRDRLPHWLKRPQLEYIAECGKTVHILHLDDKLDRKKIEDEMENALVNENLGADKLSYWHNLMTIEPNKKLYEPLPPRPIHFCVIDAHPTNDGIIESFQRLKLQQFKSFTAVYFVENETYQNSRYANSQKSKGSHIILPINTGSVGRNYEVGIIKNCPNKSFVVVLRRYESFSSIEGLKILATEVQPRAVLGSFVSLNISGKVRDCRQVYSLYTKEQFNRKDPHYPQLSQIMNHLRVFHSDCYKIIPQFDLRTTQGLYLNDRFNFVEHFLYMVVNKTEKHDIAEIQHTQRVKWYIKSNSHIFDVPNRILDVRRVVLNIVKYEEVDHDQLVYNRYTYQPYTMTYNMDHLVQKGIPMEEFAVFNPANEYEPYTMRSKPQLIPKVFHSIWIQGEIPQGKKQIFKINKELYPEYQFKIWTKNNITREKFPYSYELIKTIYDMEPTSRFGKRATMADVLRHELIYNEGGIYMDTNMMLFNRVLDRMLSYKFVLPSEGTFRHRWSQNMCIFAAMPKFPGLLRLISHNNTNHYNLHSRDALDIAGPINFRWVVRGMEQYDPDYLIMKYDTFYPTGESYCYINYRQQGDGDEVVYISGDLHLIKYCGKYYPVSNGKEINDLGGSSWMLPKW